MMRPLTTTITAPAATRDLVDLADVREQLQIRATDTAYDAWLAKVISRASMQAERYCNRIFALQTYHDYFTAVCGAPGSPLLTGQAPIVSISGITVDAGTAPLDTTSYMTDDPPGFIYWIADGNGWTAASSIATDYIAGFDTIPDDVQQAVIELCVMEFRARGRDPMLRERDTPGLGRESYWVGPPPGGATALPADIGALLDPYRRGIIG